jgi:hypothetical protein
MTEATHNTRESAELYLSRGLRPIPLWGVKRCPAGTDEKDKGKVPRVATWADRHTTFKPHEFLSDDNIALALGMQPNGKWLVGLDFDEEGAQNRLFPFPETMITKTPRGWHLYYEVRPYTYLGNWVKVGGIVDVKYVRGALVAAPSSTMAGAYETLIRPIAMLPPEVLNWIYAERRKAGFKVSGSLDPSKLPQRR